MLPKTDRTVCAGSFNVRRDKFIILEGGGGEVFCLDAILF